MTAIGVIVAAVVAFVLSSVYYGLAPRPGRQDRPAAWQIGTELVRSAITATLVVGLLIALGHRTWEAGALLGLALWVLPLVLLSGSVVWEQVPVREAARHAGDWLLKLLVIGVIVGAFA